MSRFLLSLVAVLSLTACEEPAIVGGDCTYEDTHGTCTFVDATGGADVTFDFVSDDGSVTDSDSLVVGDGGTPPTQACLDELGIAPGASVGCTMRNITSGTCSPVVYAFDDFDTNECLD
jgi:hypothetical protein